MAVASLFTFALAGYSTLWAKEGHSSPKLMAFQRMYAVDGPFLGEANALRGIAGDELPWEIRAGRGVIDLTGRLTVHVRGLVFADDPSVPADLVGKNDEAEFRAVLSCISEDEAENIIISNVFTDGFPATPSGDADIVAKIEVPNPCIAPIVFVLAGSEDKWFSVNGFEIEEDED